MLEPGHFIAIAGIVVVQGVGLGTLFIRSLLANAVLRHRVEQLERERDEYVLAAALAPQLAEIQHGVAESQAECRRLRSEIEACRLDLARAGGRGGAGGRE